MALKSNRSRSRGHSPSSASVEAMTWANCFCRSKARNRGNSEAGVTVANATSEEFMAATVKRKGGPGESALNSTLRVPLEGTGLR